MSDLHASPVLSERKRLLRNARLWAGKAARARSRERQRECARLVFDRLYALLGRVK